MNRDGETARGTLIALAEAERLILHERRYLLFLHSHGGIGCAQPTTLSSPLLLPSPALPSVAFPGAYFLYQQHQPPLPKDFLRPLTRKEAKELRKQHEALDAEYQSSNNATLALYRGWSELELTLSGLLYEVLHLPTKGSRLANVIYFSPTSLGARTTLVNDAVLQLIEEDEKGLGDLRPLWAEVFKQT